MDQNIRDLNKIINFFCYDNDFTKTSSFYIIVV